MDKNPDRYRSKIDKPYKINKSRFHSNFSTKILHQDPYIVKLKRFLNTEEIQTLKDLAKGKYERSEIVVDGETIYSTTRTSETAFITDNGHYRTYARSIENILKRVCYLTGCDRCQIESLMVVKYHKGEQYYNHHDYFKPSQYDKSVGNRIATFFCYLNSLELGEGGETEFPKIGVKSKPSRGSSIFWWNKNASGKMLKDTLHRGNPIVGEKIKYGLNIWIRKNGY